MDGTVIRQTQRTQTRLYTYTEDAIIQTRFGTEMLPETDEWLAGARQGSVN